MVKSADKRKANYEAKIDADVQRSRILARKDSMVVNAEGAMANLTQVEEEVKAAIQGISPTIYSITIPAYLNVGRELWSKQQKFSGVTYAAEANQVLTKWKARGLSGPALIAIALLFGYVYTY
jgi:hypothetical protein